MLAIPSSSRCPPRPRGINLKDEIRKNLLQEVRTCHARDTPLTDELKTALLELSVEDRLEIINMEDEDFCTPLFHAARMGNIEIAQFLVENCGADIEMVGTLDTFSESRPHTATPLWIASVYGGLPMVRYLLSQGANVNATSNSRSTPVRSACFMSNLLVVQALVEAGADITITNQCGGSCLTNAVQHTVMCEYLIQHGIDVNIQDHEGDTALHYAVLERRFETIKVLVANGADIFLKNNFGQSSFELAAYKADEEIFQFLLSSTQISFEEEANLLELMGANFLSMSYGGGAEKALENFMRAAEIREREGIQKPTLGYCPPYACLSDAHTGLVFSRIPEFSTVGQWQVAKDTLNQRGDTLGIQQLLIIERQLGIYHKEFLKKLEKSTKEFRFSGNNFYYQEAIKSYALRLHFNKEGNGLLCFPTAKALQSLVEMHVEWFHQRRKMQEDGFDSVPCPHDILLITFSFLLEHLPDVIRQLKAQPFLPAQRTCYDVYILSCSKIVYLLLSDPRSKDELREICRGIEKLTRFALPVFSTGDTLLHLAVRKYREAEKRLTPNFEHVQLLLQFGCDVNAVNKYTETPLHILLKDKHYEEEEIAELLVTAGTHLDNYDLSNFSPLQKLLENPYPGFSREPPLHLQCITAKFLGKFSFSFFEHELPKHLVDLVMRHTKVDTCSPPRARIYERLYHYDL